MHRLDVKPGLAYYWQCSGRSNLSFEKWMELDCKYINERSLWTDLKIILKTVPAVLLGRGAF
jgi:lipopolysaccharide/colanic/teichoic acid biosynthesis glycosyltransferase